MIIGAENSLSPIRVAVLFLVFNRPETTARVFEAIRTARPPRLYVAADGPRESCEDDAEKIRQVRAIATNVDWPCELRTLFSDKNLGCRDAPARGISWFFDCEEMGIVLEDDCLPSQSFFWFCEGLLEKYRADNRVFLISGYNKQNEWKSETCDYFFSNLGGIWGWASWNRAWSYFNLDMPDLDSFIKGRYFEDLLGKRLGRLRATDLVKVRSASPCTAWSYQWGFARHINGALSCVPSKSLIQNIGFGPDASHTCGVTLDRVDRHEMAFPLRENKYFVPDRLYDEMFVEGEELMDRVRRRLKRILGLGTNPGS